MQATTPVFVRNPFILLYVDIADFGARPRSCWRSEPAGAHRPRSRAEYAVPATKSHAYLLYHGHHRRTSRRAWSKADRRWASGKRQIIEGVIGQLKDFFGLERHRAKTLGGLLRRLAAKVVAYTCAQRINDSLGRPLRHLADLLI
jgi:hypothetical protein